MDAKSKIDASNKEEEDEPPNAITLDRGPTTEELIDWMT